MSCRPGGPDGCGAGTALIFEADLQAEQCAYRERRDAQDALRHVHQLLTTGYTDVIGADLSGYFDVIPHAELMLSGDLRHPL